LQIRIIGRNHLSTEIKKIKSGVTNPFSCVPAIFEGTGREPTVILD
jgi:hypothetical protein